MSRTLLSSRAGALRGSLLAALGILPFACGGTAVTPDDGGAGRSFAGGAVEVGGSFGGLPAFAGAGGSAGLAAVCASPMVDPVTHLVRCANGILHRPAAYACGDDTSVAGASGEGGDAAANAGAPGEAGARGMTHESDPYCTKDSDCRYLARGYCDNGDEDLAQGESSYSGPTCRSGCRSDTECDEGYLCDCDGHSPGRCTFAGCHTDADCPGSLCARADSICGDASFRCLTPADQCQTRADCNGHACVFGGSFRTCSTGGCGRPFLVDDTARLANIETRRDWVELDLHPDLTGLSPLERAELARHWAHLGQMEHASIAAFARFNLQLLLLGAPAELLEACNRALTDETRHARQCFALASHYGAIPLGPGKLEVRDCFADSDLASVMKLVLSEGCIGETVAALDAMEQAATASDPVVHRVLRGIARDEQDHAELAYRFMRWALAQCTDELRIEMAREAEARITAFERTAEGVPFVAAREVARPLIEALFVENVLS